jgi:serine/threonine protein kinase
MIADRFGPSARDRFATLVRVTERYRIETRIASGGMAEVFRAVSIGGEGFERRVAIKRMLPAHGEDRSFARMFVDEARIASRLHHANIVGVLDYGLLDGQPFQALEYVDGLDAHHLALRGIDLGKPMPVEVALYVCTEVAHALDHAHAATDESGASLGIVHRDVTPSNILVSWAGDVKLSDFGIAFAHDRNEVTREGTTKGKLLFMAPEQAMAGTVDGRADVFSLGCVLHALVAGKSPLAGEDSFRTLVSRGELPLDPALASDVAEIVRRATHRDREARHASATELARELGAAMAKRLSGDPRSALRRWLEEVRPERTPREKSPLDAWLDVEFVLGGAVGGVPSYHTEHRDAVTEKETPRASRLAPIAFAIAALGLAAASVAIYFAVTDADEPPRARATPEPRPDPTAVAPMDEPVDAPPVQTEPAPIERPIARAPRDRANTGAPMIEERVPDERAPPEQGDAPSLGSVAIGGAGAVSAEIFVRGRSFGFAPRRIELPLGRHTIELAHGDGRRTTRSIDVTARHTRISPARILVP